MINFVQYKWSKCFSAKTSRFEKKQFIGTSFYQSKVLSILPDPSKKIVTDYSTTKVLGLKYDNGGVNISTIKLYLFPFTSFSPPFYLLRLSVFVFRFHDHSLYQHRPRWFKFPSPWQVTRHRPIFQFKGFCTCIYMCVYRLTHVCTTFPPPPRITYILHFSITNPPGAVWFLPFLTWRQQYTTKERK